MTGKKNICSGSITNYPDTSRYHLRSFSYDVANLVIKKTYRVARDPCKTDASCRPFVVLCWYNVRPPSYACWFISPSNYSYKYRKPSLFKNWCQNETAAMFATIIIDRSDRSCPWRWTLIMDTRGIFHIVHYNSIIIPNNSISFQIHSFHYFPEDSEKTCFEFYVCIYVICCLTCFVYYALVFQPFVFVFF